MTAELRDLSSSDRVLVLAPHPDDETLATGGLLQRAAAVGASMRVVFVTDGENNPWPQRLIEYRWRITSADRSRWGARRRCEALGALAALGIPARHVAFLGLPDLGMTKLLVSEPERVVALLSAEIAHWNPTVLAAPSWRDCHPDHSAIGLLARLALARLNGQHRGMLVAWYLVHPSKSWQHDGNALHLRLSQEERDRKHLAVNRHATQLLFHRRSFLRKAQSDERFLPYADASVIDVSHPVRYAALRGATIELELGVPFASGAFTGTVLVLVVWGAPRVAAAVPKNIRARLGLDASPRGWGPMVSVLRVHDVHASGKIRVPLGGWRELDAVFVKVDRRFGVYDLDGWRAVPPFVQRGRVETLQAASLAAMEPPLAIASARQRAI